MTINARKRADALHDARQYLRYASFYRKNGDRVKAIGWLDLAASARSRAARILASTAVV